MIDWTPELEEKILTLVANSTQGLKRICKKNKDIPAARTIRTRIATDKDFAHRYARAKEEQADLLADEIIDIADDVAVLEKGELTHEKISAAKLQVDSRKWIAAKLKPKKYGDKTDITTDGESLNAGLGALIGKLKKKK